MKPTVVDLLQDASYGLAEVQGKLHAASLDGDVRGRLDAACELLSRAARLIEAESFDKKAQGDGPVVPQNRPQLRAVK